MQEVNISHLSKIPLFSSIPNDELELIAAKLKAISFKTGELIISEGEIGDCLYIISKGKVKVTSPLEANEDEIILSYLEEGDFFGEMSLITGEPRSATVVAEEDVDLWQLSKSEFDTLILSNPDITLSLTHMLSQRLKIANKAREESERYYKSRITPKGSLVDTDIIKLLKFAEENSLSGKIHLKNEDKTACFYYEKGQLAKLDFEDKDEGEAMDEILEWKNGEFRIEPNIFSLPESSEKEDTSAEPAKDISPSEIFEIYFKEKFTEFIQFAGSRIIQTALNKSYHKFEHYFDVASDIKIRSAPELDIKVLSTNTWTEKHTLFLAILLRDVIATIERDIVGLKFWSVESSNKQINKKLEQMNFYIYFEQAIDFVKD